MGIIEEKQRLREKIKERQKFLSEAYYDMADARILDAAAALPEFQEAETVFCYVGMAGEINTRPLLEQILKGGKRLGVPKCQKKGIMHVYEIKELGQLKAGYYGILEPDETCVPIRPEEIDLAVIPCMSCDAQGRRLGKGGGYYDRYLAQTSFPRAALCWQQMMVNEIPMEIYDQRMDLVITENDVIRISDKIKTIQ